MKTIFKSLTLLLAMLFVTNASALDYKIFAIVNDVDIITTQQVRDRVELVISSSGMPSSEKTKREITPEIGEILINEILQKYHAEEKGLALTEQDVQTVLSELERKNNLKPGGFKDFVNKKKLSYDTMIEQIKASIIWRKILANYVQPNIKITDEDIKKAEANKPKIIQKYKVDISEIIIPIEFASEKESKELADTIVRAARNGTKSFGDLARKYSGGRTALNNGRLGWVVEDGIKEPLGSVVKNTKVGGVSNPVKVDSLYVIMKVSNRQGMIPEDKTPSDERALTAKIEEEAKKYIKALRDAATIEKKCKPGEEYKFVWN